MRKNLLSLMIAIVVTFSFTAGAFAQSVNDIATQDVTGEEIFLAVSENPDETLGDNALGDPDNLNDDEREDNEGGAGSKELPENPDTSDGEGSGDENAGIEGDEKKDGEETSLNGANLLMTDVNDEPWDITQNFPTTLVSASNGNWRYVVGSSVGSDYKITDNSGYVNIAKAKGAATNCHVWIVTPGNPLPDLPAAGGFTVEARVKVHEIINALKPTGNKIGVRFNSTQLMEIYIGYGEDDKGFVSLTPDGNSPFTYFLDTTDWVDYRIVVHNAATFSVYVNGMLAFKNAPKGTDIGTSGGNIVKFGAESPYVCDMDIASAKIAYSELAPDSATAEPPEIISVDSLNCEAGIGGSLPLKATGTGPIGFSLEGTVPDGVEIEQNASNYPGVGAALKVAGTVAVGTHTFIIKADNGEGSAEQAFVLTVAPGSGSSEVWTSTQAFYPVWNANSWASSIGTNAGSVSSLIKQETDYVNLTKNKVGSTACYAWVVSPAAITFPSGAFTFETRAKVNDFEAAGPIGNKLSIRANKNVSANAKDRLFEIYINYGQNDGYVSTASDGSGDYVYWLDTAVFHDYRIIVNESHDKFSLYVDGDLAFENAPYTQITDSNSKGRDLFKAGAESTQVCNMDLASVEYADSALIPPPVSGVRKVELNKDSYLNNEQNTLDVTVTTVLTDNDTPYTLTLVDNARQPLASPITANGTITDNTGTAQLTIPEGFPIGRYYVRADVEDKYRYSSGFNVMEPLGTPPVFPTFKPVGYTIEMEDYKKNPTEEFQFPTVIDASLHLQNPIARYYLFYAPHESPGGVYLATSNSLYGPWEEYGDGPLVEKTWPNDAGGNYYSVSHVSAQDVVWNDVYDCYFMYFHGENTTTRYATSHDLVNWTYGDVCFVAKDFASNGTEASYGRVFEHEISGLGNKYIMLLMINDTTNMRKIYFAHSQDGKNWTAVKTPLLTPDNSKAPEGTTYSGTPGISMTGANLSGPFFHEIGGRYYVTAHASSGDIFLFEVGESLNKEIHWGCVYNSVDNSSADVEDGWPDYGRAGAPYFIRDDEGVMHMFYEGGRRLHANIIHGVETCAINASTGAHGSINPSGQTTVVKGTSPIPPSFSIIPDQGYEIDVITVNDQPVSTSNPYTFAKVMEDSELHVTFKPQSSASGDSDNSGDSSTYTPPAPSSPWLEQNSAQELSTNEQNRQNGFLRTSSSGKHGVRKSSFAAFGGLRFEHDTVLNNAVQVRLYIDQSENITKDTLVSGYVTGTEVERTHKTFERWFANQLRVIHFDQQEDWGVTVRIAAKVDLSGTDTQNLCFYSYNRATNACRRIAVPAYWTDQNGYLRFMTLYAGDIIISERPLERK